MIREELVDLEDSTERIYSIKPWNIQFHAMGVVTGTGEVIVVDDE